jgi:hypothetical protein
VEITVFLHAGITASFTAGAGLAIRLQSCRRKAKSSPRFPSVINAANQDAKDELNRTAVL